MPRLANRGTRDVQSPSRTVNNTALPDYEVLSCHTDASAAKALLELASARSSSHALIQSQLRDAARYLADSVGDMQDRLRTSTDRLEAMKTKRQQKGTERTSEEQRLEDHVAQLKERVEDLTRKSELAMRSVIDTQATFENRVKAVRELGDAASTARRGENINEDVPTGPVQGFLDANAQKLEEYNALSYHQKYALNNEYKTFKNMWHTGANGDEIPLPDPSKWFDRQGKPATFGASTAIGPDDDDDIQISREVTSTKCPLTQVVMQEPYTNRHCNHTFEKTAIQSHIRISGDGCKCPQSGCSQKLSRRDFDQDFYLDHAMLRRIKRVEQASQDQDFEDTQLDMDATGNGNYVSSDDDREGNDRSSRRLSRRPKREPRSASVSSAG